MKKVITKIAVTGVLAVAGFAGTAATASAATASPNSGVLNVKFATASQCEAYVWNHGEWGIWDCEYVAGPYGGWMIFTP